MDTVFIKGLILAAITQFAQIVSAQDLAAITDWRAWLVSAGTAVLYRVIRLLMVNYGPPPETDDTRA